MFFIEPVDKTENKNTTLSLNLLNSVRPNCIPRKFYN